MATSPTRSNGGTREDEANTTEEGTSEDTVVFPCNPKCRPVQLWKMANAFADTATVRVDPKDGFVLQCMDTSKSALFQWRIAPEVFREFSVSHTHKFGMILSTMVKTLNMAGAGAPVRWTLTEHDDAYLGIEVESSVYRMSNVECLPELEIPDGEWQSVTVSTSLLNKTVVHSAGLAEDIRHIYLWRDEGGVGVRGRSRNITGTTVVPALPQEEGGVASDSDSTSQIKSYQATLLQKFLSSATIVPRTRVSWEAGRPLHIDLLEPATDSGEGVGKTRMGDFDVYIAPHVDDDDDDE